MQLCQCAALLPTLWTGKSVVTDWSRFCLETKIALTSLSLFALPVLASNEQKAMVTAWIVWNPLPVLTIQLSPGLVDLLQNIFQKNKRRFLLPGFSERVSSSFLTTQFQSLYHTLLENGQFIKKTGTYTQNNWRLL